MESQTAQQLTNDIETVSNESVNLSEVNVAIASDASNATDVSDGLSEDNSLELDGSIDPSVTDAVGLPKNKKLENCWVDEDGNVRCK